MDYINITSKKNHCFGLFIFSYIIFYLLREFLFEKFSYYPLVQLNESHLKLQFSSCFYLFDIGKHDHQCKYGLLKRFKNINHYAFTFSPMQGRSNVPQNQRITSFK